MEKHDIVESKRLTIQEELDSMKNRKERNMLGQFATPPVLANDILKCIIENYLPIGEKIRFFDPAIGTGSFYSALIENIDDIDSISSAFGVEIDMDIANAAEALWSDYGLKIIKGDFTKLHPPGDKNQLPNLLITNPPYVRHHHIDKKDKKRLSDRVNRELGYRANGLMGLYGYFLLLAHGWLVENGLGVWLIPSEFMDVNYGKLIKEYLTAKVRLIRIHRFDPSSVQFKDALVSSTIIIFQKNEPTLDHEVLFTFGGSLFKPDISQRVMIGELKECPKWTHLPSYLIDGARAINGIGERHKVKLRDIFVIKRGIVTGDNRFFVMHREEANLRGIPGEFMTPILPSPRDLKQNIIESDDDGFPRLKGQLVLFNCDVPEEVIKIRYPQLYDYLQKGERKGVSERYLTRKRSPWYKQEHREPAPFLCTYMGRNRKDGKIFRFIWNKSEAISTNVYLLLYPRANLSKLLDENPDLYPLIFNALDNIDSQDMVDNGRTYGGGLHKIEPNELGNITIDNLPDEISLSDLNILKQKELATWC